MVTSDNPKVRKGMDLIDEMEADELDQLVDYIRHVYRSKRNQNSARTFASLRVGDRVRYTGNPKPAYLKGQTAVVTEKRQTRLVLKLDCGPLKKFRSGIVIAHPGALTKVED